MNQQCKCDLKSTSPPGYSSATRICSHVSWISYLLSTLLLCDLVSPSPGFPHQHHFLCFVYTFTHNILSYIPYLLYLFILIYLFNKYSLISNHISDIFISIGNTAMNKTDRNTCPYRVTFWWRVNSSIHTSAHTCTHSYTYILCRVNVESRYSISTYSTLFIHLPYTTFSIKSLLIHSLPQFWREFHLLLVLYFYLWLL